MSDRLPDRIETDPGDGFEVELGIELVPEGGVFAPAGPIELATRPDAIATAIPFQTPDAPSYQAIAYLIARKASGSIAHLDTSTAGTITFTELGDTPGSVIRGRLDNAAFVADGCSTSFDLVFALTQGNTTKSARR